ncbi:MAG: hypothetical protein ACYCSW_05290 [bacterium]
MKYYVFCKEHSQEKIYIDFGKEISTKDEIPYSCFSLKCPTTNNSYNYNANEVMAEAGTALGGALVGALLFLIDPVLGLIGSVAGLLSKTKIEDDKVLKFNNSSRQVCY